jgi:hypothetical protein
VGQLRSNPTRSRCENILERDSWCVLWKGFLETVIERRLCKCKPDCTTEVLRKDKDGQADSVLAGRKVILDRDNGLGEES